MQALIIADNFENKFKPLCNKSNPSCLFPIANVPNLCYIIEFLIMNNIKKIVIATSEHREKLDQFVKAQKYKEKGVKVDVKGIKTESESFGDALREVAEMRVLKDDFLVVRGDIITNINLHEALKMHLKVKELEGMKENQN